MIKLNESNKDDILFLLRKLNTEASEALYAYEQKDNLRECIDILGYLARDSKNALDKIKKYNKK